MIVGVTLEGLSAAIGVAFLIGGVVGFAIGLWTDRNREPLIIEAAQPEPPKAAPEPPRRTTFGKGT